MRRAMSVLEGVLAIYKPRSISSFDVIRTVTPLLRDSPLFQPLIEQSRKRMLEDGTRRSKSKQRLAEMKIGHGGTLDPLATGVLVVGIGNGTKSLQKFLDGTKEYECTCLFGAATDSYDILGKVTQTAGWEHITKEKVEAALETFKGEQMQIPPVYSSIRVDGKHLYEYAREGLPLPEIKSRKITVHEIELVEWFEPEQHNYDLPSQEADDEAKLIAQRIKWPKSLLDKRKREDEPEASPDEPPKKVAHVAAAEGESTVDGREPVNSETDSKPKSSETASEPTTETTGTLPLNPPMEKQHKSSKPRPPAAKIRMVVSSGFYVRSLCHDLGQAVGSAGLMAALERNRQSNFKVGENVIPYEDFEKGEPIWGPQVKKRLEEWAEAQAQGDAKDGGDADGKRRDESSQRDGRRSHNNERVGWQRKSDRSRNERRRETTPRGDDKRRRRNSSSPEPNW